MFEIERRIIPDETMQIRMAARGVPDMAVRIALSLYAASRNGEFATVDRPRSSCSGAASRNAPTLRAARLKAGLQLIATLRSLSLGPHLTAPPTLSHVARRSA